MKRYRRGEVKVDVVVLLPQELITQILLRLPVKSLLQFKSVCKSWLSLISDPHFTKLHFELAAAPIHRLMFISGWDSPPRVLSIDLNASLNQDSGNAELKLSPAFKSTFVRIGGSCRGFLLLDCLRHLCLWNPSTGVHKRVRCSPMASRKDLFFSMFQGVGYDPSTDDYLVVQLLGRLGSGRNRAEFFSVRANQWKEVEPIDMIFFQRNPKNYKDKDISGLLLNNSIHWLTYCVKEQVIFPVIFAFDLTERRFMEISLLVDFEDDDIGLCGLMKIREFLSLSLMLNNWIEIWVMKEYKVQSSWTKTIVVSLDHVLTGIFRPICSTKNGDIVGYESETRLTKFNKKGKLKENRSYNISPRHCQTVYEESLLSLPCRHR